MSEHNTFTEFRSIKLLLTCLYSPAKRNITDEKAALQEALDKYESEGLQNGQLKFSSGLQCPDLGDLAIFGVLYSVRGLNAHNDAIQSRGGPIKDWYDRMNKQVVIGEKVEH